MRYGPLLRVRLNMSEPRRRIEQGYLSGGTGERYRYCTRPRYFVSVQSIVCYYKYNVYDYTAVLGVHRVRQRAMSV